MKKHIPNDISQIPVTHHKRNHKPKSTKGIQGWPMQMPCPPKDTGDANLPPGSPDTDD